MVKGTKDIGLEEVYCPTVVPVLVDIVFVHGLGGDRVETWTKYIGKPKQSESILPAQKSPAIQIPSSGVRHSEASPKRKTLKKIRNFLSGRARTTRSHIPQGGPSNLKSNIQGRDGEARDITKDFSRPCAAVSGVAGAPQAGVSDNVEEDSMPDLLSQVVSMEPITLIGKEEETTTTRPSHNETLEPKAQNLRPNVAEKEEQTSKVFWPGHLLPKTLPNARIFTWGYDVDIDHAFSSASTATIFQHALNLLSDLTDVRISEAEIKRPIIFIAHSLGGIVVKDALNQSRSTATHLSEILPATFGVCFLGTPHRGSPMADLGETLRRITQLWGKSPNLQVLQALKYDAETLDRVQSDFKQTINAFPIQIRSFRESKKTFGHTVVDRFSSVVDDPTEIVSDIAANHSDMTKFSSVSDPGFISISNNLLRWMRKMEMQAENYESVVDLVGKECLESLCNSERSLRQSQVDTPYQDTFAWLFDPSIRFCEWLRAKSNPGNAPGYIDQIFWIQGKPGSGKSTLMKYALRCPETLKLLHEADARPWSLITFFFHDRGSEIQNTVNGLLEEILYQILHKHTELLKYVVPIRTKALFDQWPDKGPQGIGRDALPQAPRGVSTWSIEAVRRALKYRSARTDWSLGDLDEALFAITSQTDLPINFCFFIDALDEHNGNHQRLVNILHRFANSGNSGGVNIKLCLSSRPEPEFKASFAQCLGFSIHHKTKEDIENYARGNLAAVLLERNPAEQEPELGVLPMEITVKSRGVFIWVKLVVEELVEGVIDGSTVTQLRKILESIPDELKELYQRVIIKRKPAYAMETYTMFQIVLSARRPQSLLTLMMATDVALFGAHEKMSKTSMQRRLASRCGGLLETTGSSIGPDTADNVEKGGETIQFLHQTVKTFLESRENAVSMLQDIGSVPNEKGHMHMLRFCVYIATKMHWDEVQQHRQSLEDLFYYAAYLEKIEGRDVEVELRQLLANAVASPKMPRREGKFGSNSGGNAQPQPDQVFDGLHVWERICLNQPSFNWLDRHYHPEEFSGVAREYDLLFLAVSYGLSKMVKSKAKKRVKSYARKCPLLFACLNTGLSVTNINFRDVKFDPVDILGILLDGGHNPNRLHDGQTPLVFVVTTVLGMSTRELTNAVMRNALYFIEELANHGADVNINVDEPSIPLLSFVLRADTEHTRIDMLFKKLLEYGADFEQEDEYGLHPLYHAIYTGNLDATKLLLRYGANWKNVGRGINASEPAAQSNLPNAAESTQLDLAKEEFEIFQRNARERRMKTLLRDHEEEMREEEQRTGVQRLTINVPLADAFLESDDGHL